MADLTGMLQAAAGNAGEEADEDFANTVLLLHGDGTNGAQNNTFLDSSTNNFTITRNGNTTQNTFSPFSKPDGRWGNYFNGTDSKITTPSDADFGFGTGDFHISCWVYLLSDANRTIFGNASDNLNLYVAASTKYIGLYTGSTNDSTTLAPINQWAFFVVTRTGSTLQVYMNGVSILSISNSTNFATTSYIIGSNVGTSWVNAYISNFKIVKGSPWTPTSNPTAPSTSDTNTKLLTCQSNRFIDTNTQVAAKALTPAGGVKVTPFSPFPITTAYDPSVNGGAGYFDGSDTLDFPNNAAFAFGTGAFTIQFWIYAPLNSDKFILEGRNAIGIMHITTGGFSSTAGVLRYVGSSTIVSSNVITDNSWHHCAVVRDGSNNITLYVDGVSRGTGTDTTNYTTTSGTFNGIGGRTGVGNFLTGYLSGLQILKGTAIDFASTGIPTAPPTAIANTSLLCNFTNAGILDNTCFNALETVGNAQIDTTTKKFGTGSIEFDGTGDSLKIPTTQDLSMGTGDFTWECWIYMNSVAASFQGVIDTGTAGARFTGGLLYFATSTLYYFSNNSNIVSSSSFPTGTFKHIAVTRSGSTVRLFVDGTQAGSSGTSSTNMTSPVIYVGNTFDNYSLNGYIDDLRITKGVARYTTTFTPPDKAFPDIGE